MASKLSPQQADKIFLQVAMEIREKWIFFCKLLCHRNFSTCKFFRWGTIGALRISMWKGVHFFWQCFAGPKLGDTGKRQVASKIGAVYRKIIWPTLFKIWDLVIYTLTCGRKRWKWNCTWQRCRSWCSGRLSLQKGECRAHKVSPNWHTLMEKLLSPLPSFDHQHHHKYHQNVGNHKYKNTKSRPIDIPWWNNYYHHYHNLTTSITNMLAITNIRTQSLTELTFLDVFDWQHFDDTGDHDGGDDDVDDTGGDDGCHMLMAINVSSMVAVVPIVMVVTMRMIGSHEFSHKWKWVVILIVMIGPTKSHSDCSAGAGSRPNTARSRCPLCSRPPAQRENIHWFCIFFIYLDVFVFRVVDHVSRNRIFAPWSLHEIDRFPLMNLFCSQ